MDMPKPLRPKVPGWIPAGRVDLPHGGWAEHWIHRGMRLSLFSAVDVVDVEPAKAVIAPHYHVSVVNLRTAIPASCSDEEMERVREAFDLAGAEEDNHGPGKARHLWILCGRTREPQCPCKQDEERTVDGTRVRHDVPEATT